MTNLPKQINKEQLNNFLKENAKGIEEYADSIRSGYIIELKEPVIFPDNKKYNKIFIRDYTDIDGIVFINGIKYKHIDNEGINVKVKGFKDKDIYNFFKNLKK
jgi:hypothetical protein